MHDLDSPCTAWTVLSLDELKKRVNNFFCVFVILGIAPGGRFIYGYKKALTQGWTESRNKKHTTEIINCNGSDLMLEMGNLEFGTEIWVSLELTSVWTKHKTCFVQQKIMLCPGVRFLQVLLSRSVRYMDSVKNVKACSIMTPTLRWVPERSISRMVIWGSNPLDIVDVLDIYQKFDFFSSKFEILK